MNKKVKGFLAVTVILLVVITIVLYIHNNAIVTKSNYGGSIQSLKEETVVSDTTAPIFKWVGKFPEGWLSKNENETIKISVLDEESTIKDANIKYLWSKDSEIQEEYLDNNGIDATTAEITNQYWTFKIPNPEEEGYYCWTKIQGIDDCGKDLIEYKVWGPFKFDLINPNVNILPNKGEPCGTTLRIDIYDNESGLSENNIYKYYVSTSETELVDGEWTTYIPGEASQIIVDSSITKRRYLFIEPIKDAVGNNGDSLYYTIINGKTYYKFGPYVFDGVGPIVIATPDSSSASQKVNIILEALDYGASGLGPHNEYQYYFSRSDTELIGGEWIEFRNGDELYASGEGKTGVYYLFVKMITDSVGNLSQNPNATINGISYHRFGPYVFDNTIPTISVNKTQGNWAKSHAVTITVADEGSKLADEIKLQYAWGTSKTEEPTEWDEITTKSETIVKSGITGKYYLWIKPVNVKDIAGNELTETKVFGEYCFDNDAPTIEFDPSGNEVWKKEQVVIATIKDTIIDENKLTASQITSNEYGGYVTNYSSPNGINVDWRIFHSDGNNIYLISDDYIENKYVPAGKLGTEINKVGSHSVSFTDVVKDYEGLTDINTPAKKWLSKYTYSSMNNNAKVTAYLLDTLVWSGFTDDTYAEYTIGAPTLELFAESYNVTHEIKKIETCVKNSNGYQLRWSNGTFWDDIQGLYTKNNMYVMEDYLKASGMWIASPSNYGSDYIMGLSFEGNLAMNGYYSDYIGLRPIVALKSDIALEKQEDGTYQITDQTISGVGINKKSIKYIWSKEEPTYEELTGNMYDFIINSEKIDELSATIKNNIATGNDLKLWVYVEDLLANGKMVSSDEFYLDNKAPTIEIVEDETHSEWKEEHNIQVNLNDEHSGLALGAELEYGWSISKDIEPIEWKEVELPVYDEGVSIISCNIVENKLAGKYYLWIKPKELKDISLENGNCQTNFIVSNNVFAFNNIGEGDIDIIFSQNGNAEWAKVHSTIVNVTGEYKPSLLKYQWTIDTNEPEESTFKNEFTSGQEIEITGETGKLYLWILAKDEEGNSRIEHSNSFYLDNEGPKLVVTPSKDETLSNVKIITTDVGSGLKESNNYEYALINNFTGDIQTSWNFYNQLNKVDWKEYKSDESFTIGQNLKGEYYLIVKGIEDNVGNANSWNPIPEYTPISLGEKITAFGPYNFDKEQYLEVTMTPNGNTTWDKQQEVVVRTDDTLELKELKYLWTRKSKITNEMLNEFVEMENNEKVISPNDARAGQDWYLWVYVEDIYGNIVLEKSSEFYIDTTAPIVEFTPNGNDVWAKSQTVEVTFEDLEEELKRLGANDLTASNYGGYVTNYSPKNRVNVGWRIFHSDGNNIYLIADDYIENEYIPSGKLGTEVNKSEEYKVYFTDIIKDYEGLATTAQLNNPAQKWLSQYTYASTNNNAKSTAYLIDTSVWSEFIDTTYAEYALGGPALELFAKSYNVTHENRKIETQVNNINGYQLKWSDGNFSNYIDGLDTTNNMYAITDSSKTTGMWIASPSNHDSDYVIGIACNGSIAMTQYYSDYLGIRPIVALKSNVQLEEQKDGTFKIVDNTEDLEESDGSGINTESIKYLWQKESTIVPIREDITESLENIEIVDGKIKGTVTKNSETGDNWKLWIYVQDMAGNSRIIGSEVFALDNTAPEAGTLTMKLDNNDGRDYENNTWTTNSIYIAVNNGSDEHSGHKSTVYTVNGTAETTEPQILTESGTYEIIVTTSDKVGNIATSSYVIRITKATSLEITSNPVKMEYNAYDDFNDEGIEVVVVYDNGDIEETTDYTILNGENLTCQTNEIQIQYNKNPEIKAIISGIKVNHKEEIREGIDATCTEKGKSVGKYCEICNTILEEQKEIPALGHEFKNYVSNNDATCEADGTKTAKCIRCAETKTVKDEGSKLQHNYETKLTEATCTADGYTTYTCTKCNDTYIADEITKLGHEFENYVSNNDATCTEDGTKTAKCTRCDETKTVTDEGTKLQHNYETKVTEATCIAGGYTTYTCTKCNDTYRANETTKLGHEFKNYVSNNDATCTEDGTKTAKCTRCAETKTVKDEGSKLQHNYETKVTEATCTAGGYTTYTCTKCNDTYRANETTKLGHEFKNYVSNNDATCTEDGTKTAKCTRCDETKTVTDEGSKKTHKYEDGECIYCGEEEPKIRITSQIYTINDEYISELQPKTTVAVFKANIQTNATEINIYDEDGETLEANEIIATGMQIELKLGNLTRRFEIVVKGDLYSDGKADILDMIIINYARLRKETLTGAKLIAADIVKDGKITIEDLAKINKFRLHKISEI